MSCQIKCSKCRCLCDKEPCATRKHAYYRTCKSCRDKMNSKGATRKGKPEQSNDLNWKNVVFGKSKPAVTEEPNDDENVSNESEPHNTE